MHKALQHAVLIAESETQRCVDDEEGQVRCEINVKLDARGIVEAEGLLLKGPYELCTPA
jgi:hypothetical protein